MEQKILKEISQRTSVSLELLQSFKEESLQKIEEVYRSDNFDLVRIYELVSEAITLSDIEKVGEFIGLSEEEINNLSMDKKIKICGMYDMEFDQSGDNSQLIKALQEIAKETK